MQLIKYNPIRELQKMEHDMDKFWENGWSMPAIFTDSAAIDLYEEDGKLIGELSLPQFKKEEITITTDEGVLQISAKHEEKEEKKTKRRYFLRESRDQFFRRITLPEGADGDKAEASFEGGVLKITMPMVGKKAAKAVAIK